MKNDNNSDLTIGLPIFNGEKFLRKKIQNILDQTYKNFELIISDNCSTDQTGIICNEFVKKDDRIKYYLQKENMGVTWNVNFVVKKAKNEFFILTAVDDLLSKDFLEKNIKLLKNNPKLIGCIGKILPYEISYDDLTNSEKVIKDLTNKMRKKTRPRKLIELKGKYDQKVRNYLMKSTCQVIYGMFRTKEFQTKEFENFIGNDWAVFLNVLQYGDFIIDSNTTMYEYESGLTGRGIKRSLKNYQHKFFENVFPWYSLTKWCVKNLGFKLVIKNSDYFIILMFEGWFSLIFDVIKDILVKIGYKK